MAVLLILFPNPDPLTVAELDRLCDFLESCKGGKAEISGILAAASRQAI